MHTILDYSESPGAHEFSMNTLLCSISVSNYSACSVKTLTFFWPPTTSPDPLKSIHCLSSNHSEIYPSLSTATDTHHSAPPAKITVITPLLVSLPLFSSLYQAICSTRLTALIHYSYPVIPSKKKKKNPLQNYCCYLLSTIQNLISLFWHARYFPLPCPIGPYLPFSLFFHTTVCIKHPFLPYSIQHHANKSHHAPCHPHICVHISPSIPKYPIYFHPSKCTGNLSSQWFLWPVEPILISFLRVHCPSMYHNSQTQPSFRTT